MDITALASSLSQGKIMSQVNIALSKMGMELTKEQGQALTKLMESSVKPHIGANIDIKL